MFRLQWHFVLVVKDGRHGFCAEGDANSGNMRRVRFKQGGYSASH